MSANSRNRKCLDKTILVDVSSAKSADELLYDKVPGEPVEMGYVIGLLQLQRQGLLIPFHTIIGANYLHFRSR